MDHDSAETPPKRRKYDNNNNEGVKPNSFAAKMMAKMGYQEGQGLGADGRGRLAPIETKLRPQGAGLGVVKERTKQAKEEEKRAAAFRGEKVEDDSSEEERKRRKERKEKAKRQPGAGTPVARPKVRYTTITEKLGGLEVPANVLKSLVDITGGQTKFVSPSTVLPKQTEASKIATRLRHEIESIADEMKACQDQKRYFDEHYARLVEEVDAEGSETESLRDVIKSLEGLQQPSTVEQWNEDLLWENFAKQLETIEVKFQGSLDKYRLQEAAVAAIHPMFRKAMLEWEPLEQPTHLVAYLARLQHILGSEGQIGDLSLTAENDHHLTRSKRKTTTCYESMMHQLWLPPVRRAISTTWDAQDPEPCEALFKAWRVLLPPFTLSHVQQLLISRLSTALAAWKPSRSSKNRTHSQPPDRWLLPWLLLLPEHHRDPTIEGSLLTEVRRKLRSLMSSHDLTAGIPTYLHPWKNLLGSEYNKLLITHLLPRLGRHLTQRLVLDPSGQDLSPLTTVLTFSPLFPPSTVAELLVQHFFPKFHAILHEWLTGSPDYEEIGTWFAWWQQQIPPEVRDLPPIEAQWTRALETMNLAMDLGDRAATDLPSPSPPPTFDASATTVAGTSQHGTAPLPSANGPTHPAARAETPLPLAEPTFRDVVERWCEERSLVLARLPDAHATTGAPLFRLSGGARGGVLVYMRGDVLWARDATDRARWEPVELGDGLVARALGR